MLNNQPAHYTQAQGESSAWSAAVYLEAGKLDCTYLALCDNLRTLSSYLELVGCRGGFRCGALWRAAARVPQQCFYNAMVPHMPRKYGLSAARSPW